MPEFDAHAHRLLGELALQLDFIDRDQWRRAMRAWSHDKARPLAEILVEQGALDEGLAALLEVLVERHVERHGGNSRQSLSSLGVDVTTDHAAEESTDRGTDPTADFTPGGTPRGRASAAADDDVQSLAARRFEVLRHHASGGMGKVSVALDYELHREVAFKELHERLADDDDKRQRFVFEAEITGALEHPGIVPVYGMGRRDDGRPFYAMRFVQGQTLRGAIQEFHTADNAARYISTTSVEFRKLLDRFLDVCHAVGYAHSRGVVHRDIKPANIVLGKHGETLVLDWGLAKLTDRPEDAVDPTERTVRPASGSGSFGTMLGSALGTPQYMSPEQAAGHLELVGRLSDIYSLGATLHHIVTGQTPVDSRDVDEVLDRVRRGDFTHPRAVNPRIPKSLEAICLRAMALRPEDRYPTTQALVDDLEQWEADGRVAAHRESWMERLTRWGRRHRTWMRAGALILILTVIGATTATILVNLARQEAVRLADENQHLAVREGTAKGQAVARLRDARMAVDRWLTGIGELMKAIPEFEPARLKLLEQAVDDLNRFAAQSSDDPELELERVRAYARLGLALRDLSDNGAAREAYENGQAICRDLLENDEAFHDARVEAANAHTLLGVLHEDTSHKVEAESAYRAALAELKAVLDRDPEHVAAHEARAGALVNLGSLLASRGDHSGALAEFRASVAEYQSLSPPKADDSQRQVALALSRANLASQLSEAGDDAAALVEAAAAVDMFEKLVEREPYRPDHFGGRAEVREVHAEILDNMGRDAESLPKLQQALLDHEVLMRLFPHSVRFREHVSLARINVTKAMHDRGQNKAALALLESAQPELVALAGGNPDVPDYELFRAVADDFRGEILAELDKGADARAAHAAAVAAFEQLVKHDDKSPDYAQRLAVARSHLAASLQRTGDAPGADELARQSVDALTKLVATNPDQPGLADSLAYVHMLWGDRRFAAGNTDEARASYQAAREVWKSLVSRPTPVIRHVEHYVWLLLTCPDVSMRDATLAVTLSEVAARAAPDAPIVTGLRGAALVAAGRHAEALPLLDQAIKSRGDMAIRERFLRAVAMHKTGQEKPAREDFEAADRWLAEHRPGRADLRRWRDEIASLLGIKP